MGFPSLPNFWKTFFVPRKICTMRCRLCNIPDDANSSSLGQRNSQSSFSGGTSWISKITILEVRNRQYDSSIYRYIALCIVKISLWSRRSRIIHLRSKGRSDKQDWVKRGDNLGFIWFFFRHMLFFTKLWMEAILTGSVVTDLLAQLNL